MQTLRFNAHGWAAALLTASLSFTAAGCKSGLTGNTADSACQGGSCHNGSCQGGACPAPLGQLRPENEHDGALTQLQDEANANTPAAFFAEMNYKQIAAQQSEASLRAERVAKIPKGPDSLFAPFR